MSDARARSGEASRDSLDEILRFVYGEEGRAAARSLLRRRRLPLDLDDDVLQITATTMQRKLSRGDQIDSTEAMARTIMRHATIDLLRGHTRREARERRATELDPDRREVSESVASDGLSSRSAVEAFRRRVLETDASDERFVSMALTFASVAADDAMVGHDCPRPSGHGADPADAPVWAALWYAGHRDLLPRPGQPVGSSAAQQRRRSAQRFMSKLAALAHEEGGDG